MFMSKTSPLSISLLFLQPSTTVTYKLVYPDAAQFPVTLRCSVVLCLPNVVVSNCSGCPSVSRSPST